MNLQKIVVGKLIIYCDCFDTHHKNNIDIYSFNLK